MTLPYAQAVDIGHGRGRLAAPAAASLRRVDADLGRPADVNEAWRSPETADENYRKYQAYLHDPKNNPWAPLAFPAAQSVHCVGYAVDTDDTSPEQMKVWNDHGWYWTVYRNGTLIERWHLEYFPDRDNHRNDPDPEEDDMYTDADRTRDNETNAKVKAIHDAVFKGGTDMKDANRSLSETVANIVGAVDRIEKATGPVYDAVFKGGTSMPDDGKSIGESLAGR